MFRNFMGVAVSVFMAAAAYAAEWMNDWDAAKARAAAEGKPLLVCFTGSDWCVPCMRLHQTVFESPSFDGYAKDKFIFMEVDMPRKHPQPEALAKQNSALCHQFRVEGFPTVAVVSPEGLLIGGFAGAVLDVPSVCRHLEEALANGEKLKQAATLEGAARARALYGVYRALPEAFRAASGVGEELLAADPDNITGFRTEQQVVLQWEEIHAALEDAGTDPVRLRSVVAAAIETALPPNKAKLEEMLAQMDFSDIYRRVAELSDKPALAIAFLEAKSKEVPSSILGDVLTLKAEMQIQAAESVEDILAAKACMEQAFRVAPPPSPTFRDYFEKNFADPAAFLEKVKRERVRH